MNETQREVFEALLDSIPEIRADWLARFDAAAARALLDTDEARKLALRHMKDLLEAWLQRQIAMMAETEYLTSGWVSVEERLPEVGVRVLTVEVGAEGEKRISAGHWEDGEGIGWVTDVTGESMVWPTITHWRPLPPPPAAPPEPPR